MATKNILYLTVILILFSLLGFSLYVRSEADFKKQESAVWEWRGPLQLATTSRALYFDSLAKENIHTIYLNIGEYIDIKEKDPKISSQELEKFNVATRSFLEEADAHHIKVEALSGSPKWIQPSKAYVVSDIVDYVLDYNEKNKIPFTGIHFDIEYANDPQYAQNKERYANLYLNLVQETLHHLTPSSKDSSAPMLPIGFTIPYWLGRTNGPSPEVSYNNTSKSVGFLLYDILSTYPESYVVIMAYRNYPTGPDSSTELSRNDLEYVKQKGYGTRIIVGQETTDVSPAKITFYGKSKKDVNDARKIIIRDLSEYKNFGGVAFNSAEGFLNLENK